MDGVWLFCLEVFSGKSRVVTDINVMQALRGLRYFVKGEET